MQTSKGSRPSLTAVLITLALAAALVGNAVAGTDALTSKITKAKVRAIAQKQIAKAAPGLVVAEAGVARSLLAHAEIRIEPLRVNRARNIDEFQVSNPSPGFFCFNLDFSPAGVQATPIIDGGELAIASAIVDPFANIEGRPRRGGQLNVCPQGTEVQVITNDTSIPAGTGTRSNAPFYIQIY